MTDGVISNLYMNSQTEAATIEELAASMEEISSNTSNVDSAKTDQGESFVELSRSINNLSELVNRLGEFGNELRNEFNGITGMARSGKESSQSLDTINHKILTNSNNIQSITEIIDDFFDRINLLSLNASIEAARAGEHGRGFAVVADEISKLADNSSSELNKITELIDNNRRDMESANAIIGTIIQFIEVLGQSLSGVGEKALDTLNIISSQKSLQDEMLAKTTLVRNKSEIIRSASNEQSVAIEEVMKSIENTNAIVQQTSSYVNVLKDNYEKLSRLADALNTTISSGNA